MILRFEYRRYRLPFRAAVRTAHGVWAERDGVILRIEDANGNVGYGEAAPLVSFGTETADEIAAVCADLGTMVDDTRLSAASQSLGCLRNAVAAARADLAMKVGPSNASDASDIASNVNPQEGPSYLSVAALLPAGRAAIAAISAKSEMGFRVFKWKVGVTDIADELVLLDDVCAELPDGAKLRLDANGAWDRRKTERWLEVCADRPVEFLEQPIARDARGAEDLLFGLAADFPTPIALDESVGGEVDLERWIGAGWPGIYVVKTTLLADVAKSLARLGHAKAPVVFSSALETALGARAALRHAFSWSGDKLALGFGVWPLFQDARFDGPAAGPFLYREDVERLNPEAVWTALR